ncbi:hypothetical protein JHN49_44620, partial [Streptomyces sp. MBT57]|nr:hypothetical protein [Streptomyces sp. MBT57]
AAVLGGGEQTFRLGDDVPPSKPGDSMPLPTGPQPLALPGRPTETMDADAEADNTPHAPGAPPAP